MVTRSNTIQPGDGPAAIKIGPAAGFGILLLAIGLSAGVFIGSELQQAQSIVAAESHEVARQAGRATTIRPLEDYGIRHLDEFAPSRATTIRPLEDYGIRHLDEFADWGARRP
jgi:hypothetical protein